MCLFSRYELDKYTEIAYVVHSRCGIAVYMGKARDVGLLVEHSSDNPKVPSSTHGPASFEVVDCN